MGEFIKDRLPDAVSYFESEDVPLKGRGLWRTGPCLIHGGSDSLKVNTASGGWICMSCGAKGGDVLSHLMQSRGIGFVEAARQLGAYDEGKPSTTPHRPATLPARDAMQLAAAELTLALVVIGGFRIGVIPTEDDWARFTVCASRVEFLAREFRV
jgi:hypothetical protein